MHGISSDNKLLPTPWQEQFAIARNGAFPALSRTREEGIIKGWGIGVNTPEPILRVMQESDPDVCLLASQYSLNEAQRGDAARQSPMRMARIGEARPILKEARYYPLAPVGAVAVTLRN